MSRVLEAAKEFGLARAPVYTQSHALNNINYHVLHGKLKLLPESSTISFPFMHLLCHIIKFLKNLIRNTTKHKGEERT